MRNFLGVLLISIIAGACSIKESQSDKLLPADGPIQLHPENHHYFLYEGKPLALISSAEHYGSVINQNFDFRSYLETLSAEGMNYTRIFTGTYFEIEGESFKIQPNTLAPKKEEIITPWARVVTDQSGEVKYDISIWNEAYFERLRDFMAMASDHEIIVEVSLFSSFYKNKHWGCTILKI